MMNEFIIIVEFRPRSFDNRSFRYRPVMPVVISLCNSKRYLAMLLNVMKFPDHIICDIDLTYINIQSPYLN